MPGVLAWPRKGQVWSGSGGALQARPPRRLALPTQSLIIVLAQLLADDSRALGKRALLSAGSLSSYGCSRQGTSGT